MLRFGARGAPTVFKWNSLSALTALLNTYRSASVTEREKGTYFEELIYTYLCNEATYRDLYEEVWT